MMSLCADSVPLSVDRSSASERSNVISCGDSTSYDVRVLLDDAPAESIKQKISVQREEQMVEGPLSADQEATLGTDVVSEKVDLDLVDGQVRWHRSKALYFALS